MTSHLLLRGKEREVYALVKKDRPIFEEDLYTNLPQATKNKIEQYIVILANAKLPITNKAISRKLKGFDNLFELKPIVRIFYFYFGRHAVIISGCFKKNKKENQKDMERANKLKVEFLSEN